MTNPIYIAPHLWKHIGQDVRIYENCTLLKTEMIAIGDYSRIDAMCKIEGGLGVTIGSGVHISSFVHLNVGGGILIIGDNASVTTGACIITGSNTMDGQAMSSAAPIEMQVVERSIVTIGECAMVAAHAVVLPGVTIGRYAIVGAGAVVTKDVPDYAVVMGVPAKIVGDRRDNAGWNYQ